MTLSPNTRTPWLLVLLSALALEAAALYFQYGLGLDPCVMCVYQRTAILGIAIGGIVGLLGPGVLILRVLGYVLLGVAAFLGLQLALDHVAIQSGAGLNCDFFANFPSWAKLDEWFPAVFMPTGSCDDIAWSFAGLSMPQWMVIVFAAYLVALLYAVSRETWRIIATRR